MTKIWRVWLKNWVCHALLNFEIKMDLAGSIFELQPPNFVKIHIFWISTNDSNTIFCQIKWHKIWKNLLKSSVQVYGSPCVFIQHGGFLEKCFSIFGFHYTTARFWPPTLTPFNQIQNIESCATRTSSLFEFKQTFNLPKA